MKHFIFTLLIILMLPGSATAQPEESQVFVEPGSLYQNRAEIISRRQKEESLKKAKKIEIDQVELSLVHYSYMEPDQFGIMMKTANSESGCFEVSPIEYEANFIDKNYMDIKVKSYRRKPVKVENVAFDCDQKSKIVSGLLVLSAKDLAERKIRKLRFSNGRFRDEYQVSVLEDSVHLKPESMVAFKAVGLTGPEKNKLIHYFSGKGIVALHVPMAKPDDNVAGAVRDIAYRYALNPIFEQDGLDTSGEDNIFYFMDPDGKILSMIGEEGYTEFGEIHIPRPYVGPQGRSQIPVPLRVFATRPGTTL
ncbi:MAG: hypothetical protein MRY79_06035 [Alphaproteobacteria bacterium]|nr:hypothetical protein [Alphaproteobacteria bacterium]